MGNYIKTLILSTIVLVIGNNSNYCYSMVVHHVDQYGIRRTVDDKAIPDKDANGNVIENEHFLQDINYIKAEVRSKLHNLMNLEQNLINGQNITKTQRSILRFITNLNFLYRDRRISRVFEQSWKYLNHKDHERLFNVNIVNNRIPGVISQNILNKHNSITLEKLSECVSDKIYSIVINNIERTLSIINSWNGQNFDELIDEIIVKMFPDYCRVENIIQSFYNFCDNHLNNLDEINQKFVKEIKHMNSSFTGYLKRFKQKFMEFYDQVEKIQQDINDNDDLINFDSCDQRCLDIMLELHRNLENRQNPPQIIYLLDEFGKIYMSLLAMFKDLTTSYFINEYPDYFEHLTNDELDNIGIFKRQLSNSITIHVIGMLINIKNGMINNCLNQKQLEELILNSISHCIKDLINALNNIVNKLEETNNPLTKIWSNDILKEKINGIKEQIKILSRLHHVDHNGIKRTVDNKAIPDTYKDGNIAKNAHFLQDSNYLENQFNDSKNILETQLNNLVENRVYNQGDVRSLLNKLNNFFNKCSNLCDSIARIDERLMPQSLFKVGDEDDNTIDILNSEESGFDVIVAPDKNTTTFKQLSNYLVNKIYYLIIDSIRKMSEDTSSNLNINDLKKSINNKIFECSTNIEKNINVFLNFCYHNINDEETNNFIKLIIPYTNQLQLTLFHKNNNLNSYQ